MQKIGKNISSSFDTLWVGMFRGISGVNYIVLPFNRNKEKKDWILQTEGKWKLVSLRNKFRAEKRKEK